MAYEFRLPDLGEGLTEAEIAGWLVAEGDHVEEDQPLVEVQTDKTTVEIPSPRAGTVLKILVAEGDVAPVGAVLVVIGEEGEQLLRAVEPEQRGEAASEPIVAVVPADPTAAVRATPAVRQLAKELGTRFTTGVDDLRNLAVARLMLDNFPHIKGYWIMITPELTQVSLSAGVSDIDGTIKAEKIAHASGAVTAEGMDEEALRKLIRGAGRAPVLRDALYRELKVFA